jgi:trigger factor
MGVEAQDYVEIFDYNNMGIPKNVHYVPNKIVNLQVMSLLGLLPPRITDRAVVIGDAVDIDFVMSVNGIESDHVKGVGIIIGNTNFIDDLKLVGLMPGDTINVEGTAPYARPLRTFPSEHPLEARRFHGRDALFSININFIFDEWQPELNDEFTSEKLYDFYGATTVDEMKERVRKEIQKRAIINFIDNYITNEVNVSSIPEQLMRYIEQVTTSTFSVSSSDIPYGMSFREFREMIDNMSEDEIITRNQDLHMEFARRSLVLQAVAEHGGFSVSREDVEVFYEENFSTIDYSWLEERFGLPYIMKEILHQKVFDHIVENAVLLER